MTYNQPETNQDNPDASPAVEGKNETDTPNQNRNVECKHAKISKPSVFPEIIYASILAIGIFGVFGIVGEVIDNWSDIAERRNFSKHLHFAQQVDAPSQFILGTFYEEGKGTEKDYAQAYYWYKRAAESGHNEAKAGLGRLYRSGRGVNPDIVKALQLLNEAASRGSADAAFSLGVIYSSGRDKDVLQDHAQSYKWYKLAFERGHTFAADALSNIYLRGLGVEQNYPKAEYYYLHGTEIQKIRDVHYGFGFACYCLGEEYETGKGQFWDNRNEDVEQSLEKAAIWYARAINFNYIFASKKKFGYPEYELLRVCQKINLHDLGWDAFTITTALEKIAKDGNVRAQAMLGEYYMQSGSYRSALKWLTLAAEQKNAQSQLYLGYLYNYGLGVMEDRIEAFKWYLLAGMNDPAVKIGIKTPVVFRNELQRFHEQYNPAPLTEAQIKDAQKRAESFIEESKELASIKTSEKQAIPLFGDFKSSSELNFLADLDESMQVFLLILMAGLFFWSIASVALIVLSTVKIFFTLGYPGWAALIPFYNLYILEKITGRNGWLWLITLLSFVVLFVFAFFLWIGYYMVISISIGKKYEKRRNFIYGLIFLPFLFYPILAFGKAKYSAHSL